VDYCLPEDVLLDLIEARLLDAQSEAASAHLASCPACRATLEELEVLLDDAGRDRPLPGAVAETKVLEAIRKMGHVVPRRRRTAAPKRWTAAAAVFLAATVGLVGLGLRELKAKAVVATVVSADSRVVVRRDGVERPVVAGMSLREGDVVAAPMDSTAVLDLPDASRAEIGPESALAFHRPGSRNALELRGGFLALDAAHRPADRPLAVVTPDARAEVLGTRFSMGASPGETHLRVSEGLVHFIRIGDGASVDVASGHRAEVSNDVRRGMRTHPSLPGAALVITSKKRAPAHVKRFDRMVADRLLACRLRHLGFRVEAKDHLDVTASDLVGRPLVIVSFCQEEVGFEQSIERIGLRTADVPVLCLEPAIYPVLGLTGVRRGVDYDWLGARPSVTFPNPAHPLAGGLSGTRSDLFGKASSAGWARPGPGAVRIATIEGDASQVTLFAYEAGTGMVGAVAPRRRVGLFLDPAYTDAKSEAAWGLLEAAVEWCVEPPTGEQYEETS
jgi:ferric-dicitrate binding protein FerR (iron transport regulator)